MAAIDLDNTEQPMDPKLVLAIESAFRFVSVTPVQFVPAPQAWHKANPGGGVSGPKGHRKAQIKIQLAKRDGARCAYCAREFVDLDDATLDHVIPNTIVRHWQEWNLLLACGACNNAKADQVPLPLMPLLLALLGSLAPVARYLREARKAEAKASGKQSVSALRREYKRKRRICKAIEDMGGRPYRLAIEAGPDRAALPAGTDGE
ncbi:HNH endonuclease [Streptomyces sp. NBC_00847]|uniref:HNH endonuclease n=1 Tax=Streptomyces sp. NBC_00847 TaxID=2975850 RepID=UPI00225DDA4D|nr:HNH endonuclease [Streptomyces sp. NBC_00847]MCX4886078.1 HNH endonuclease [Streptomyces sp. NBC_00847]